MQCTTTIMTQTINISPNKKIVTSLKKMMEQKEERRKKIIAKIKKTSL